MSGRSPRTPMKAFQPLVVVKATTSRQRRAHNQHPHHDPEMIATSQRLRPRFPRGENLVISDAYMRTMGRPAAAHSSFEHALTVLSLLARDNPNKAHEQELVYWTLSNIGMMHRCRGHVYTRNAYINGRVISTVNQEHQTRHCWSYRSSRIGSTASSERICKGNAPAPRTEFRKGPVTNR